MVLALAEVDEGAEPVLMQSDRLGVDTDDGAPSLSGPQAARLTCGSVEDQLHVPLSEL